MSELVEDYFQAHLQSSFSSQTFPNSYDVQVIYGLISLIQKANTQGYNFKIQQSHSHKSQARLKVIAHLRYSSSLFDLVIEIQVDIKRKKLKFKTSFLQQEEYFLTESSVKRKIICRKLSKINNEIQVEGLKFIQHMENGKIFLLKVAQDSQILFRSKQFLWFRIKNQIERICAICRKLYLQIYQLVDKQAYKKYHLKNGGQELKKIKNDEIWFTRLLKQLQVSHLNFGFSFKPDQASFSSFQKTHELERGLRQFLTNVSCQKFQPFTRKLFVTDFQEFLDVPFHLISYEVELQQGKIYSKYLKNPQPKEPIQGQNIYIFNHIQILNPENVKFKDTTLQGGMNKILASRLTFYYCRSVSSPKSKDNEHQVSFNFRSMNNVIIEPKEKTNPILTKLIAIKVPKKTGHNWDQKYQNQKNIIKLFRSAFSAYVLKYYVSTQINFEYKEYLLLDFLPNSHPLSNFMEIHQNSLSLNSKAFLIVNIANSLRFINDYLIVHMDLTLNNILVCKDYLTKLIDFGEAYSSKVLTSSGNFKRGYTFPFCAPEYFERKNNFSGKQDVFSLGIIIWRLIFSDYPFFTSSQAVQSYKNKSYLKKIMLAPERGEAYGNIQTLEFIYRLVFKCLQPNELLRCQASWLTIFFKIIYFYLL